MRVIIINLDCSAEWKAKQVEQEMTLSLGQASKVHMTRLHPSLVGGRQHCFILTAPPLLEGDCTPVPLGNSKSRSLVSHAENLSTHIIALHSEVHCIQLIKSSVPTHQ
ncbi:hypothetical protein Ciccas_013949 [Cichlidogyrus casuarinus]|uniref:Uncharacterized protein n=1 Tax=Cichlidogyrus casuarinus TaxID=1844966 RepID=A0ABD2PJV0_9PLAT